MNRTKRSKHQILKDRIAGIKADVLSLERAINLMEGADLAHIDAERDFDKALLLLQDRVSNLRLLTISE
jgi:hypothetical protein